MKSSQVTPQVALIDKIVSLIRSKSYHEADRLDTRLLMITKYPHRDYQDAMVLKNSLKKAADFDSSAGVDAYQRAAYLQTELQKQ